MIQNKYECCGCQSCVAICPVNAITMKEDEEGFLYSLVDKNKCISCRACERVCAFKKECVENSNVHHFKGVYAVKHLNDSVRMNSRSGGIFTAVSDYILQENGVVYGAVLEDNIVKHIRAESVEERNKMRGSKYVQSMVDVDIYKMVKKDVLGGRKVLYTGTSCQISSLNSYMNNKEYANLICMDIVCHGVPSPKVFKDYILYWEKKKKDRVCYIDFRNKKRYGWATHIETIYFDKRKAKNSCLFTKLFYSHNILRPSCFKCPYKSLAHPGDITIADYWGIDKALPGFNDDKGVSLVLVNTNKGASVFETIKQQGNIEAVETDIEKSMQPPLKEPFAEPKGRKAFWTYYQTYGFTRVVKMYAKNSWIWIVKYRIKKLLIDFNLYKIKK